MRLKPEEAKALIRIRRLKRAYWSVFFSILVMLPLLAALSQETGLWSLLLLVLVPFVSGMVIQQKLIRVRCPRCGEPFFYPAPVPTHATSIPSQQRCQHCQLSMRDL